MKRLVRDQQNHKVFGLCSGIGNYFGIDPNLIRLIVVTVTIMTAFTPGILSYLIAAAIIPKGDQTNA